LASHQKATNDTSAPQPGYAYARTKMKAKPLSMVPKLEAFEQKIAENCGIPYFNIGVHPVLYRSDRDSMGDHADDDQGEEIIFCGVVECRIPRRVKINVMERLAPPKHGDEIVEIILKTGDCYEMNGEMQKSYSHAVPKVTLKHSTAEVDRKKLRRICVVLRNGIEKHLEKDNGHLVQDFLTPSKPVKYTFGSIPGELSNSSRMNVVSMVGL
jgi:2OG-Fe(II) oxygenase superfamily